MNEGVEKAKKGGVTAGHEPGSGPDRKGHDTMVNDVQKGDLIELFAGHKAELEKWYVITAHIKHAMCNEKSLIAFFFTHCVNEFREFAEVVQVARMHHLKK